MVSDRLRLVQGHTGYVFMPFPHLCPGCPCAIAAWLADVYARKQYEKLKPARLVVDKSKDEAQNVR